LNHIIDGLVFLTLKIIIVENNVNKLQHEFQKYLLAKMNSFLKEKAFVKVYQLIDKPMHQI
jgi:Fe-S cluster biosynthesis and repair protein YggX